MSSMSGNMGLRGPSGLSGNKIPSGYKQGQMANFTPDQMNLFQQMFGQVSPDSYTSRLAGGDQSLFNEIEAPALRQFQGMQGQLASRFSGMGSGARNSSGFQNQANQQSSDFAQQLQAQRQGLQRQAIQDLMNMSGSLLSQRPYEDFLIKKQQKPSFLQQLFGGVAPLAGGAIGGYFGGPAGAAAGFGLGNSLSQGFNGQGGQSGMDWSSISQLPTSWGNQRSNQFGNMALGGANRASFGGF